MYIYVYKYRYPEDEFVIMDEIEMEEEEKEEEWIDGRITIITRDYPEKELLRFPLFVSSIITHAISYHSSELF